MAAADAPRLFTPRSVAIGVAGLILTGLGILLGYPALIVVGFGLPGCTVPHCLHLRAAGSA